jgi:anaerobic selenocysteine-containing dehydrogenase
LEVISHGCTLDCWDCCKFNVYVENENVIKIEGDKNHPYTKGFICIKGKKHMERLNHKDRIYKPLLKMDGKWEEISFEYAIKLLASKLGAYKEKYGSQSVLHYYESGSGSILKGIQDIFFNFYGGITRSKGSTCWGAGIQAQRYDFGDVKSHSLEDMLNSKNIFVWGRNPSNTCLHTMQMIKKAKSNGVNIIVIDPIYTDSAKISDKYIRINPSTDGALAMAMTKIIIEEKLYDEDFINRYVLGFDEYKSYLDTLDIMYLSNECGVEIDTIKDMAHIYSKDKYNTIYLGYGFQKYKNGGNTIRAIDALCAITGQIGKPGGGVNYANRVYPDVLNLDPYNSSQYENNRYFNVHNFANFINKKKETPVKLIMVSKANPLNQWPNLNEAIDAFKDIEFKVCIDMFMTDTAKHCDLFIPCTNTLETEDIIYSSMGSPYIIYNEKAVEPRYNLMDEYYFFMELAKEMKIKDYPYVSKEEYLNKVIEPLKNIDSSITLEKIKTNNITIHNEIAWGNLKFKTPSEKYEIYSNKAKEDNQSPIPIYTSSKEDNKIRLITTHPRNSLFSQHFLDVEGNSKASINKEMANIYNIENGEIVILKSQYGEVEVELYINDNIPNDIIHMYIGWWHKHGNPNFVTYNGSSDMGGQVTYNESFVDIIKQK